MTGAAGTATAAGTAAAAGSAAAGTAAAAGSPWSVYGTAGGHLLLLTSWNNVSRHHYTRHIFSEKLNNVIYLQSPYK